MKFLLPLLRNNLLQLSHANQLRYADTKNRTKTITLYMLIAMILMGLLAYLIYSLKIIYSIAWSLEEVVTELVVPMVLICVILNIAISIFWGSGLLLSDTNNIGKIFCRDQPKQYYDDIPDDLAPGADYADSVFGIGVYRSRCRTPAL